jgi:excisionase family DNA binding protein
MPDELLTPQQVADFLHVEKFTVYRLLAQKQLPAFKVGNQWRFKRKMIEAWVRKNSNVQKKRLHLVKPIDRGEQTAEEALRINQSSTKKALVVEDHPDMVEILAMQMERLGFTVISASNGKEGVEKAIAEKPDMILMDIMMPGMDGRDATRLIRSNPETQHIPILATTALFRSSDLSSCIQAGCSSYISKPFTPQDLQEKIQIVFPSA